MTARATFRVYFVSHGDDRWTGILMRSRSRMFDVPLPAAYGRSQTEVLDALELQLQEMSVTERDQPSRYLWTETFHVRRVLVDVYPQARLEKQLVIGKRRIPIRLSYAWTKLEQGGYRVMLPRFGWWLVLEDLEAAADVLKNAVSTVLLGDEPRWIYEFREQGDELVIEWAPDFLKRMRPEATPSELASRFPVLDAVGEELVDKATRGKLPLIVGMEDALGDHLPLLTRERPPSLLVVGGSGVGKTTWVHRLAQLYAETRRQRSVPRIWATSGDRILAGMMFVGMWQERCLGIVRELSRDRDYLFVDRLTGILGRQPDGASIAELLTPAILGQEIGLIAECTEPELERARHRFPALVNACHVVRLVEPSPMAMPPLLALYQTKRKAKTQLHAHGLKRLVHHLSTLDRASCFPGKAFRFMDWMASAAGAREGAVLYPSDVSEAFARYTGLPLELISDERTATAEHIAGVVRRAIVGQDAACAVAARVLARFKAGLQDPQRPLGSLFLVGPTGVGKTELAKQLARYLFGSETRMIRLDMSEYMAPGASSRLLEVGEGVTSLAEQVRRQPLSLVLLDEIEKAHPDAFDLLLGVLGEGRLTDTLGRLVDFRMTLICLTSNLGVSESAPVGFGETGVPDFVQSVRGYFRPEFFNRLDHVVSFRPLAPEDVARIVDLELDKAAARTGLVRRSLRLRVDVEARARLAALGFHRTHGARPLKRVLEERVVAPLAVRMASDPSWREREVPVVCEGSAAWHALADRERADAIVLREPAAPAEPRQGDS